jgi:recombinational DNA repair protein (RecF pathway)
MHHIHRTKAFVINSYPIKEADKQLILLTRDFGLIRAIAMAARKSESKMRQSLQNYSECDVALVSGRTGWRLTNVAFIKNFYYDIKNTELRNALCRVFALIERMIVGEDPDPGFFEIIEDAVATACSKEELMSDKNEVKRFEAILNAQIMAHLGYLNKEDFKNIESKYKTPKEVAKLIKEINQAIQESNL